MVALKTGVATLFVLLGAIMVLAMHSGFAFLALGTVRYKNQVNALVKILVDFAVSTIAYLFVGYTLAYGTGFLVGAETLAEESGYERVKLFFLLSFAAAIPAIVSGGIAERARSSCTRWAAGSDWSPGCCSCGCSRCARTAGRSTLCWACGPCTDCAAPGATSPAASSASGRSAAWAGSAWARRSRTALGIVVAVAGAAIVCGVLRRVVGLRLSDEEAFDGADIAIHRISATPEREVQY